MVTEKKLDVETLKKNIEKILQAKDFIESFGKAQIVQGPPSSSGRLGDMDPMDVGDGIAANDIKGQPQSFVGGDPSMEPGGVNYISATPGQENPKMGKSQEMTKGDTKCSCNKKDCKDCKGNPKMGGEDLEKTTEKSMEGDAMSDQSSEIVVIDDVMGEIRKAVGDSLTALTMRFAYFMKSIHSHMLETANVLSDQLQDVGEQVAKSFDVLEGEEHQPVGPPQSVTTPQEVQKSNDDSYTDEDITEMLTNSAVKQQHGVTTSDLTMWETERNFRPEVFKSLGIHVQ